jgi:hypothetical protein
MPNKHLGTAQARRAGAAIDPGGCRARDNLPTSDRPNVLAANLN